MYRLVLLFVFVFGFGVEIDTSIEKQLSKEDVVNRLFLVKYYFDKNITKAKKYNEEVLKIDKNNKIALENEKKILTFIKLKQKIKNIDDYYQKLYFEGKYKKIKNLSKYLFAIPNDYPKIITAKIYMWDGDYKTALKILNQVKNKDSLDYVEIKAYSCFYSGDYRCAKNYFSLLFNATSKLEYAYKLIDSYLYLGETKKAKKLLDYLLKSYKNNPKLETYQKKLKEKQIKQLQILIKNYQTSNSFDDLQILINFLLNLNKKEKAYQYLTEYIKKNPTDLNAKYWYAVYLSWDGNNKKALKILKEIETKNDYKTKLLIAKIYAWNGDYKKALNYLNDILANCKDKTILINAKLQKGLIYYWRQRYYRAKLIFKQVLKYQDFPEAQEAIMVMNGNIKPLILKYKKLYLKDMTNLNYILKIAQYSEKIDDIDTAIEFYEKYYKIKPTLNIAKKLADLYLLKKNFYKGFSYYEYWAYEKGDNKSLYQLANAYYYNGFSKSALEVLNDILKKSNYKPALKLKAKILRFAPKFTQNNDKQTILEVFNKRDKNTLDIANALYFNGFYDDAINYFKEYLLTHNDISVRERYAYALEFSGQYKQSSGEFFLVSWHKKDCNTLYHYGYNLEMSNQKDKAKKIYYDALNLANKPAPKFIKEFIKNWKKAWESQNINKYKKFYIKQNKKWYLRKEYIFRKVRFISVYIPDDIVLLNKYKKGDYEFYKVRFYQQYTTNKKRDRGYKTLILRCKNKKCLIQKESWQKGKYIPTDYKCYSLITTRLENMKNKIINNSSIFPTFLSKKKIKTKDKIVKGIVIIDSVKRPIVGEKETLGVIDINLTKNFSILKGSVNYTYDDNQILNKKFGIVGYYFRDITNLQLYDYGVFYQNKSLYLEIKKWKLWQYENSRDGKYFTLHKKINNFEFGGEIGNYQNKTYIYPYLKYKNLLYYQSITGKEKQSFCAIDEKLKTHHLVYSKYKGLNTKQKEITKLWYSFELSKTNNNFTFIPQFEKNIAKTEFKKWEIFYQLSGWYQTNSNSNQCYYSPKFYDSTFLEIHPIYKKLELIGKIGYSFSDKTFLYSYGFDFSNDYLNLKCMKNFSIKGAGYWYEECNLKAGVKW